MRFPSGYNDNPPAATIMLLLFPGSLPFLLSSSPGQTCVCITDTYLSSKSETQFSVNHYLVGEPTHCQPQSLLYIHSYLHFHRPHTFASLHITHIRLSNKNNNNNLSSSNYFPFPISYFIHTILLQFLPTSNTFMLLLRLHILNQTLFFSNGVNKLLKKGCRFIIHLVKITPPLSSSLSRFFSTRIKYI